MLLLKGIDNHIGLIDMTTSFCSVKGLYMNIEMDKADTDLSKYEVPAEDMYTVAMDLISGLNAMHAKKLYHRDIKPANILVKNKRFYFCDYGLTRQMKPDSIPGTGYVITRWYRPPELLADVDTIVFTPEMDMWSIGVVLWEVVFHRLFASGNDAKSCLGIIDHRILTLDNEFLKMFEKSETKYSVMRWILKSILKKSPHNRVSTAKCLKTLQKVTQTEAPKAAPLLFYPLIPSRDFYTSQEWDQRCGYFRTLHREYPKILKSVIAHAILLFDNCMRYEDMRRTFIMSILLSNMIFKDMDGGAVADLLTELKTTYKCKVLEELSKYMCKNTISGNSEWERGEMEWDEFFYESMKNPIKRIRRMKD